MVIMNMSYYKVDSWWKPWANTLLYYDFEHTSWTTETNLASTWSTYNWVYSVAPTISTLSSGKKYFDNNASPYNFLYTANALSTLKYNNCTVSFWFRPMGEWPVFWQFWWVISWYTILADLYQNNRQFCIGDANETITINNSYINWNRSNVTLTNDGSYLTVYINWIKISERTVTNWESGSDYLYAWAVNVWWNTPSQMQSNTRCYSYWGSVIVENKVRTEQEIAVYFYLTKWNYWIN